jgi:hypothetical protein
MAVWQYTIYLVPNSAVAADGSLPGVTVADGIFDLPPLTFAFSGEQLERSVETILPSAKSWHADLRAFGDDERHDINIWYESGRVRDVRIRIDLRSASPSLVRQVASLGKEMGCCFFQVSSKQIVQADEAALTDSIKTSRPARFVNDPRGFLESLASKSDSRRPE